MKKRVLLAAGLLVSTTVVAQTDTAPAGDIETVLVIGEKIERAAKDATSSVAVLSEETLNTLRNLSLSGVVSEVPNVVVLSGAVPDIRGVSGNGSSGGFNSISGGAKARVSVLMDGIAEPFVADFTGDSGIWDVEQVEVYRGSQSTINGRNSIGGAIYIKTRDPSFDWEAAGRLGYRSGERYIDTAVMLSGPIVDDELAFRVTAQRLDGQTLTDDSGFASNPPFYDLNGLDTNRIRAKLLWAPSENFEALLAYSDSNEKGDAGRIYYNGDDPWAYERVYFRNIETDMEMLSLTLKYDISDSLQLELLTALIDYEWGFDSYYPDPAQQAQLDLGEDSVTIDARLRFGETDSFARGLIGLARFDREQDILSEGAYSYYGDDENTVNSLYGEVEFALNDRFTLIAGGRWEKEEQLRHFTYLPIVSRLDVDERHLLPKLVLQYALDDDVTLALSGRKGYNSPGGAVSFAQQDYYYYDKETVDTYEFNVRKGVGASGISLVANLFYNDYNGYQAVNSRRAIVNLDKVVTYGVEMELNAYVSENLELSAGFGWLSTEVKKAEQSFGDVVGNELNSAPEFTASFGVRYWITPAFNAGTTVQYVDEYYGDFNNTPERIAGNYTLVRLFANYDVEHWSLSAFINNLTDKKALTLNEPVRRTCPRGCAAIVTPRNVGVSLTYRM